MAGAEYWEPAYQLMLEEARRSIDRQSARIEVARGRAIGLVGLGSVVGAALGLANGTDRTVGGAFALTAFLVVVSCALYVLRPRAFAFELRAHYMLEWLEDPAIEDLRGVYWATAAQHDDNHDKNQVKINRYQRALAIGVAALAVETLALFTGFVL